MENMKLEEKLRRLMEDVAEKRAGNIVGMIAPRLISADAEKMSSVIAFPVSDWELNPNGVVHGGIMATMIDTAIGITTIAVTETLTPTINLQISYLRPCPPDGVVAVRSYITMLGGSVIHTRAEAYDTRDPDALVATAEGAYRLFKSSKPYLELFD